MGHAVAQTSRKTLKPATLGPLGPLSRYRRTVKLCSVTHMVRIDARSWASLMLLACAAFAYNTSESFPVGLLPQMADDLQVAESRIGSLLTVYAVVVAITVLPLVVAASGVARRRLILVTVGVLVVSNIAMALAPGYGWVLASRLVSATTHGIFWSVVAPTAAMLVPRGREGFATSVAFMGSSLAMVAGTPLMTALGSMWGWRTAITVLAGAATLAFVGLALVMPALEVDRGDQPTGLAGWLPLLASTVHNRSLLKLCALTVLLVVAYYAAYTYISLILDRFAGVTGDHLAVVLLLYGLAGIVGVWAIGKITDTFPQRAALVAMGGLIAAFVGIGVFASWAPGGVVASVVLLGAAFAATPVFLQATVLRVAPQASDVASSLYVVAFQIGIAGGSLVGGLAVDGGLLGAVPWVAGAAVALGLLTLRVPASTRAEVPTPVG
ncbi:MAG TPA: MFS transporter [Friedmanniella sp.]